MCIADSRHPRPPPAAAASAARAAPHPIRTHSLALAIFLASLDQTIVSTAIPAIVKDFQALDQIAWIGTSYLLTSTSFSPLYGKFADTFGRKATFLFAVAVFEIGSLICGVATSMNILIFGRAIAGVGGGGVISLVLIIISDIVSFRDRGKYQGVIGAVFGLSSVLGPLLGGAFTDGLSWRWCFYINLPIGGITMVVIFFLLRLPREEASTFEKFKRIDFLGTALIIAAVICMLIPLQFGGNQWAWSDWRTIIMIIASAVIFVAFFLVEAFVSVEPVLPPSMYENRSVYAILFIAFTLGASFFGLVYFLPTYFQIVNGDSATSAGLSTIPFVGGLIVMSIGSGIIVSRWFYFTPFFFVGSVVLTVGALLMSTMTQYSTRAQQVGYQLIAGLGVGSMIQMRTIGIQASVTPENIAVATAAATFFQSLGGSIGVAIVGTVFQNVLANELGPKFSVLVSRDPSAVRTLPEPSRTFVLDGFSKAFNISYKTTAPLAGLIFIAALFVKQARGVARPKATVIAE
nr:hypothetical protein HK105_000452 [Polyrhizophydium stewartii]